MGDAEISSRQPGDVHILAYFDVDEKGQAWMTGVLDHLTEIDGLDGLDGLVLPVATGDLGLPPRLIPDLPGGLPLIIAPDTPDTLRAYQGTASGVYLNAGLSTQLALIQPDLLSGVPLYLTVNLMSRASLRPIEGLAAMIVEDTGLDPASDGRLHLLYALQPLGLPLGFLANLGEIGVTRHAIGYGASTIVIALRQPSDLSRLERGQRMETARRLREHISALRAFAVGPCDPLWEASAEELDRYDLQRLSLVAARDLKRGEVLTADMVRAVPPYGGISADLLPHIVGLRLAYDLPAGKPITFGMLGGEAPQ